MWLRVVQGYGLTETCGASFIADPYRAEQSRTVGPPVAGLDVRLECAPVTLQLLCFPVYSKLLLLFRASQLRFRT